MIPLNLFDITSFSAVQANLAQLTVGALLLSGAIVAVWYFVGVLLQNNGIKASARSEFYQLIGTVVMVIVIVGVLTSFSAAFYSSLSSSDLLSSASVSGLCYQLAQNSQLQLLSSGQGSLLSQSQGTGQQSCSNSAIYPFEQQSQATLPQGQYGGICSLVDLQCTKPTLTQQLDYPLASTGVIIANLTNQTATNLNQSFVVDAFLGFLQNLRPYTEICVGLPPPSPQCLAPIPAPPRQFDLIMNFTPDAGYKLLTDNMNSFSALITSELESFVAQLVTVSIFLYMWPYILFIGIVLRSNFLTRKLGGLLMAIAIGLIMFFPAVYSIEYLTLGHGLPSGPNTSFGFNTVTALPSNALPSNTVDYTMNFFVQPNVKNIAMHNLCWPETVSTDSKGNPVPVSESVFSAEFSDIAYLLIPFSSIVATVTSFSGTTVPSSVPNIGLPANCQPQSALHTFYAILDSYGIIGITAFWLPVLNLFMTITAILGLSGLLGGDTSLGGLERLI
ncbi:MAG: hypothetical protein KGH60_00285 [Candidatus Micrarchaeota archaeon]|nr:hypothetical protein [Candidatus Micrarchaeota archaeon]